METAFTPRTLAASSSENKNGKQINLRFLDEVLLTLSHDREIHLAPRTAFSGCASVAFIYLSKTEKHADLGCDSFNETSAAARPLALPLSLR